MITRSATIRRVLGIGLTWGSLWLAASMLVAAAIGVVDPDSIDPGEIRAALLVLGPMGLFSGMVFGMLVLLAERGLRMPDLSISRAALWGILGTAVVQLGYLDHGDAGLAANLRMALVFCGFGGVIATAWLLIARRWSHRRSLQSSHP